MRRHELSEEQRNRIKEMLLPEKKKGVGRPAKDNRVMLNGIIYWLNTGIRWRDLPERLGHGKAYIHASAGGAKKVI